MTTHHLHVQHPNLRVPHGTGDRIADTVAGWFGSMGCFYVLIVWQFGWMALATMGFWLFAHDRAPFPLLLFTGNLIQLFALPILGVATNRADVKRTAKADADHLALTYLAQKLDSIEAELKQDTP